MSTPSNPLARRAGDADHGAVDVVLLEDGVDGQDGRAVALAHADVPCWVALARRGGEVSDILQICWLGKEKLS